MRYMQARAIGIAYRRYGDWAGKVARFELGTLEEPVSVRLSGERRKMPGFAAVAPLLQGAY